MMILWAAIALMSASVVLDVETTLAVLREGGSETNPTMAWILKLARNTRFPVYCFQAAIQFTLAGAMLKLFGAVPASAFAGVAAGIHAYYGAKNWKLLK